MEQERPDHPGYLLEVEALWCAFGVLGGFQIWNDDARRRAKYAADQHYFD